MEEISGNGRLEWGAAARALPGQAQSGDGYLVEPFSNGLLVAAVDGLGHGEQAAEAARLAIDALKEAAAESVGTLMLHCHRRLRQTRGVVMSLASFDTHHHTMSWLGVGNVEGVLLRAAPIKPAIETLLLRGGVVGYRLPPLREVTIPLKAGDTLILVTDGIRSGFIKEQRQRHDHPATLLQHVTPQQLADEILSHYARPTDDALALVARYPRLP